MPHREATGRDRAWRWSTLLSTHGAAVGVYILIVFFDGAGEAVVAGGIGDEVVIVALGGVHGRFQSAFAGIGDGAGGKSDVSVGVVGRIESHVVVVKCA